MDHNNVQISLIIPIYNEEKNIPILYDRITSVMKRGVKEPYEIIFVDDGSIDNSLRILRELKIRDSRVRYVSFSRNFGHQIAICAGFEATHGKAIISMDGDLQHPPELLPEIIAKWHEGYQIVSLIKEDVKVLPFFKHWFTAVFYALIRRISNLKLSFGASDFRLLDRVVVEALKNMPEKRKFLRGLVDWTGYRNVNLPYKLEKRYAGKPKYTYSRMFRLAFDAIFSFSLTPLRVVFWLGIITSSFCFLYAIFITIVIMFDIRGLIYKGVVVPGWLSIMVGILFLGGIQLVGIGMLGEYIGRVYEETQNRPLYLVKEVSDDKF